MIDELPRYPDYKDSGAPWLGRVPEHWEVLPNRALFTEVNEREHPEEQMLSVTITKGVIRQRALLADSSKKDGSRLDKSAYKLVRPGDIAYNKMRAWQGAIGASNYPGIVSPAYVVQRPREGADSRYLHYLLRTPAFAKEAERWSYGITSDMWSLRPEHFRMIYGCLPPLEEQGGIVRFLDHVDRRIRRYIAARRRLIELLNEEKQAVIHRAVTRGLDPDVNLKPSGVEWLGDVPEHWEVRPLKFFVPQVTVGIVVQPARLYADAGVPCLRSFNISGGVVTNRDMAFISPEANNANRKSQIFAGDIVVVRTGRAGIAAIVPPEFDRANCIDLLIVRKSTKILSDYLLTYLNSWPAKTDVKYRSVGAIQSHYNTATLANMVVATPPVGEQLKILDQTTSRTVAIASTIIAAERQIALMREYSTRLIADVVTGKLDVREAGARLPVETDQLAPPDEVDVAEDTDESGDYADLDDALELAEI